MYVYLETQDKVNLDGGGVALKPSGFFNCRGEVKEHDDPRGFCRLMGKRGLRVAVMDKILAGKNGPGKGVPGKILEAGIIDFKEAMMERILRKRKIAMAEAGHGGTKKTDA